MLRRVVMIIGLLIVLLFIIFIMWFFQNRTISLDVLNDNLNIGEIKFGMTEDEVNKIWGSGEYVEGFGGHGRNYKEKGTFISFSNDRDDSLYGRVSQVSFTTSNFSVYSIKVGDDLKKGIQKLISYNFNAIKETSEFYKNGEFMIGLRGNDVIERIEIWFNDKDLKNRVY